MAEYRIDFTITRREDGEEDFTEIGFGSSGACHDLDACTYEIESAVTHGEWETEGSHPDPDEVMQAIRQEADRG